MTGGSGSILLIRIREAQKHTDPMDPDSQHCVLGSTRNAAAPHDKRMSHLLMEQEMFEIVESSSLHVMPAAKHGASGFFPRKRNRKECPSLPYPGRGGGEGERQK
jgi:hypothetical protein